MNLYCAYGQCRIFGGSRSMKKLGKKVAVFVLALSLMVVGLIAHHRSVVISYCRQETDLIPVEKKATQGYELSFYSGTIFSEAKNAAASTSRSNINSSETNSSTLVLSKLIQPDWTSLKGNQGYEHHFYSAYYDGRSSEKLQRPAIIVMGYVEIC